VDISNLSVPEISAKFGVTLDNTWNAITWEIFDSVAYAAAGQAQLTFFQTPIGGAKTASATNMTQAGQLPANQMFVVETIEVLFWPTVPAVAADEPAAFGAQAVAAQINDMWTFLRTGNLALIVGTQQYAAAGPMARFPSRTRMGLNAALADVSTAGANFQSRIAHAYAEGPVWRTDPNQILIEELQSFHLNLNWPEGNQAITNPGWVQVYLGGTLLRKAQG
jgi:hypothetical protein